MDHHKYHPNTVMTAHRIRRNRIIQCYIMFQRASDNQRTMPSIIIFSRTHSKQFPPLTPLSIDHTNTRIHISIHIFSCHCCRFLFDVDTAQFSDFEYEKGMNHWGYVSPVSALSSNWSLSCWERELTLTGGEWGGALDENSYQIYAHQQTRDLYITKRAKNANDQFIHHIGYFMAKHWIKVV